MPERRDVLGAPATAPGPGPHRRFPAPGTAAGPVRRSAPNRPVPYSQSRRRNRRYSSTSSTTISTITAG
jgi:hypothetical protein